jgi:hypothetical protein
MIRKLSPVSIHEDEGEWMMMEERSWEILHAIMGDGGKDGRRGFG